MCGSTSAIWTGPSDRELREERLGGVAQRIDRLRDGVLGLEEEHADHLPLERRQRVHAEELSLV